MYRTARSDTIALTQDRFVTALEQMANFSVLAVMVLAVGRKQTLHDPADWIVSPFDQQVNVVGHQAVSVEVKRQPVFLAGEQREKLTVVFVQPEDRPTIVTASADVVEPAFNFTALVCAWRLSILPRQPIANCNLHA